MEFFSRATERMDSQTIPSRLRGIKVCAAEVAYTGLRGVVGDTEHAAQLDEAAACAGESSKAVISGHLVTERYGKSMTAKSCSGQEWNAKAVILYGSILQRVGHWTCGAKLARLLQ
jgi:hypothetical protein